MPAQGPRSSRLLPVLFLVLASALFASPIFANGLPVKAPQLFVRGSTGSSFDESIDHKRLERGLKVLGTVAVTALFWVVSLKRRVSLKTGELQAQLRRVQKAEKERDLLNAELKQTRSEIAFTLGEVIESRSHETANHVRRVAAVTEYLACKMGYIEEEAGLIGLASSLHDVGKIGTPEAILNKEGKLTPEEFEIVKRHTTLGHKILSSSGGSLFDLAAVIALEHHEKWDGSGYPQGLAGNAISQEARIVAVVDVFDALANRRVYKAPWPLDRIVQTLIEERGRHFDPSVVDLFLRHLEEIIALCRVFPDHTETAPRKEPPDHESLPERILSSPHLLS